jgi:hypothetical protein
MKYLYTLSLTAGNSNSLSQLGLRWGYTYSNDLINLDKSEEYLSGILG